MVTQDADCYMNDHFWHGGGVCSNCGTRLRCDCGVFAISAASWWDKHLPTCRLYGCQREDIGTDCRCPACEESKVEAAEAAQEASEGR